MNNMIQENSIIIFTDGAARGNPGLGGWGSIVILQKKGIPWAYELSGKLAHTTNNAMELTAVLESIKSLVKHNTASLQSCVVYSDSHYVVAGMMSWIYGWQKNGWKSSTGGVVANQELWKAIILESKKIPCKIQYIRVAGHAGVAGNERCDVLATMAADGRPVNHYNGPLDQYPVHSIDIIPVAPPRTSTGEKKSSPKNGWYISSIGGVVERHMDWDSCKARVHGQPARYKKVTSEREEQEFLSGV